MKDDRTASVLESIRRDIRQQIQGHSSTRVYPFRKKLAAVMANRGVHALILYRLSNALWKRRIPLLPFVLTRLCQQLFAVDISYRAHLGPGIVIFHGFGIVIGSEAVIQGDCYLYQGATLGDRGSEWVGSDRHDGHPTLEPGVVVAAGAKILGPIRIGAGSVIGANAVVLRDVPPNSIVAGIPARVVGQKPTLGPGATSETIGYGSEKALA